MVVPEIFTCSPGLSNFLIFLNIFLFKVDERIEPGPEDEDGDVEEEAGGNVEEGGGGGTRADNNHRRHQTEEQKPQPHHENQARKQKQNHRSASAHDPSGFHRGQEDPRARHSRLQRQQQQRQEGIRGRGEGVDVAGRHPPPAGQQTPGRLGGSGCTAAVAAAAVAVGGTTPARGGAGAEYPALTQGEISSPPPGGYRGLMFPTSARQVIQVGWGKLMYSGWYGGGGACVGPLAGVGLVREGALHRSEDSAHAEFVVASKPCERAACVACKAHTISVKRCVLLVC